mgnify:CR=1 FL=1
MTTVLHHPTQLKLLLMLPWTERQFTRGTGAWLLFKARLKSLTRERMIGETSVGYFSRFDAGNDSVIFGENAATTDTVTICRPSALPFATIDSFMINTRVKTVLHNDDYLRNISFERSKRIAKKFLEICKRSKCLKKEFYPSSFFTFSLINNILHIH